jgi:hypothetical protein
LDNVQQRARISIVGRGPVVITLQLPQQMETPTGQSIPVSFGPEDAGIISRQSSVPQLFDPRQGMTVDLNQLPGGAILILGGTSRVATAQPAGSYSARIVVILTQPGA